MKESPTFRSTAALVSPTRTRGNRNFYGVGYLVTILLLGANIPTPLYSLYRDEFGFTAVVQTLIFAVYVGGLVPALLFFGPLSDALGRRFVLFAALGFGIAGAAILGFADSVSWLFVGRIAQGICIGASSAAGAAALIEHEPDHNPRRAALAATVTTALGAALGPFFGGAIAQYLPHALTLPYVLFLMTLVPALIALILLPSGAGTSEDRARGSRSTQLFQVPRVPAGIGTIFWLSSLSVGLSWGAVALFQSIVPSWIITLLGVNNLVVAGGAAALAMVCSVVTQTTLSRLAAAPSQRIGLLALVVGLVGLLMVNLLSSLALLVAVTVAIGIGHGLTFSGAMRQINAAVLERAPDAQGGVLAAFFTVNYAGVAISAICAGFAVTAQGMHTAITELSVVGLVLCVLLFVLARVMRSKQAARPPSAPAGVIAGLHRSPLRSVAAPSTACASHPEPEDQGVDQGVSRCVRVVSSATLDA